MSLAAARAQRRQAGEHQAEAAAALLTNSDKLPPAVFKGLAKLVLGAKKCPSKKSDILAALEAMLANGNAAAAATMEDEADVDAKPAQADRTVPEAGTASEPNGYKGLSFGGMQGSGTLSSAARGLGARPKGVPVRRGEEGHRCAPGSRRD